MTEDGAGATGHPREGELPRADGVGDSGSLRSGPAVRITLRVDTARTIVDARFRVVRFDAARPFAAALCDVLVGAGVEDASRISAGAVARLGGSDVVTHAARTVHFAKSAALQPFLGRAAYAGTGITCVCFGVSTDEIRTIIRAHGCRTVDDVRRHLPATQGCGTCRPDVQALLDAECLPGG